jgi:bacteriorhodopsin
VLHALLSTFKDAANYRGPKTAALYSKLAILMAITWSAYPIIWVIGEGSQVCLALNILIRFLAVLYSRRSPQEVKLFVYLFILSPSP